MDVLPLHGWPELWMEEAKNNMDLEGEWMIGVYFHQGK